MMFLSCSVVAFLVAFFCVFFQKSTSACRTSVGTLSLAVAILIVWCIWTSWENAVEKNEDNRPLVLADAPLYGEQVSEETASGKGSNKGGLFDRLRSFPAFLRRRDSDDSDVTAV